jgi:ferritin-like metal-binding protein YciE
MSGYDQKIVQYLEEAHATELSLVRVLQSQIAMTPRGTLRTGIEKHLEETRSHAERVRSRIGDFQRRKPSTANPFQVWFGLTEAVVGQSLALAKAPLDMVRGTSGEEKVLKNAKDDCATEGLEIATYTAIERLAREAGDTETAELAASILADERRMLDLLLEEIPKLTDAVAKAELEGKGSFDPTTTGAAEAVLGAVEATTGTAKRAAGTTRRAAARTTRRTARTAAKATGQSRSTASRSTGSRPSAGRSNGANGTNGGGSAEAPISGYDGLNATEIVEKLPSLSQRDLAAVKSYERAHEKRSTVLERVDSLEGREPWAGYDEQDVQEVVARLRDADEATVTAARDYERRHKGRTGVLEATERQTAAASA